MIRIWLLFDLNSLFLHNFYNFRFRIIMTIIIKLPIINSRKFKFRSIFFFFSFRNNFKILFFWNIIIHIFRMIFMSFR